MGKYPWPIMGCGDSTEEKQPVTLLEKCNALFDMYDENNSGFLEHHEAVQLCRVSSMVTLQEAEAMMTQEGLAEIMTKLPGGGHAISKAQLFWGYQNQAFGEGDSIEVDYKKCAGVRGVPKPRPISEAEKKAKKLAKKLAKQLAKEAAGELWDEVKEELVELDAEDLFDWDWLGDIADLFE